jgi:hypothetical protein
VLFRPAYQLVQELLAAKRSAIRVNSTSASARAVGRSGPAGRHKLGSGAAAEAATARFIRTFDPGRHWLRQTEPRGGAVDSLTESDGSRGGLLMCIT